MAIRQPIDEVARRGAEIYETRIRALIEDGNLDRYVAIDIDTGDYALADQRYEAAKALLDKNPDAQIWGLRVGHIAASKFGGGATREKK